MKVLPNYSCKLSNPRPPGSNCIWPPTIQTIHFLIFKDEPVAMAHLLYMEHIKLEIYLSVLFI